MIKFLENMENLAVSFIAGFFATIFYICCQLTCFENYKKMFNFLKNICK